MTGRAIIGISRTTTGLLAIQQPLVSLSFLIALSLSVTLKPPTATDDKQPDSPTEQTYNELGNKSVFEWLIQRFIWWVAFDFPYKTHFYLATAIDKRIQRNALVKMFWKIWKKGHRALDTLWDSNRHAQTQELHATHCCKIKSRLWNIKCTCFRKNSCEIEGEWVQGDQQCWFGV